MPKRFFWIKLKDSFFKQLAIKKLRKVAGGDTFVIIYLKMMLLSMNNEGKIIYECNDGAEFAENLALDLDEEEDNVNMTLAFLKKHKLIEFIADGEAFLPEVVDCIGSETKWAEKKRKYRENKALEQGQAIDERETMSSQCPQNVTLDIEKEKDIEKDIESSSSSSNTNNISKDDDENLFRDIEYTLKMPITQFLAEQFLALREEVGYPALKEALEESAKHGARSYAYVATVARKIANGGNVKSNEWIDWDAIREQIKDEGHANY